MNSISNYRELSFPALSHRDLNTKARAACGAFGVIKRELLGRSALEPVIGHLVRRYLKLMPAAQPTPSSLPQATTSGVFSRG
jgi:hypothetical protein